MLTEHLDWYACIMYMDAVSSTYCFNLLAQPDDLSLKESHVATGILVDDGLVTDVLGSACKLQRAESLLRTHLAGADVCYDHCLCIPTQ